MCLFTPYLSLSVLVFTVFKELCFVSGTLNITFVSQGFSSDFHNSNNEPNSTGHRSDSKLRQSYEKKEVMTQLGNNPFNFWIYKSKWVELSDLQLNADLMSRAIQTGDPTRLRNVLIKALNGGQINLLVIGGSNSAGGKLGVDEGSLDGLFYKVFTNWWNNTIGRVTKAFMKEFQVTIGGTGSYFFAYCYNTFIPKHTKFDIVLMEASINYNTRSKAESLEQLTRQVLAETSAPAVLYINLVSGIGLDPVTKKIFNPSCSNLEDFGQTKLAHHYRITSFSLKEVLCRRENGRWRAAITNFAGSDGRHIGVKAHALIAMLMIQYVRGVFSDVLNDVEKHLKMKEVIPLQLPDLFFIKRETDALTEPLCWTGITPNAFTDLPHPTLQIDIIYNEGFTLYYSKRVTKNAKAMVTSDLRTDAQGGWGTWNRGNILKFGFHVRPTNSQSPSSRSVTIVTRTSGSGGKAKVWLDSKESSAIYIDSKSVFGNNQLNTIGTRVEPGYHTVTVQTVRWGMFLVSGLLVGPPDFQRRRVV